MAMQQPNNDEVTAEQLIHQLSPKVRKELLHRLRLEELRSDIRIGIDAADRGELVSLEELNKHLDAIQQKHTERHSVVRVLHG